ncbi:MAG: hypothetical protein JXB49_26090 [Bacteroidales bacterium]|nr:hypothetical protein [Bacteroidales bacterium]
MSRTKDITPVNVTELRVLIVRHYDSQKAFCDEYKINYETFKTYLKRPETMPRLNDKIIKIMLAYKMDPFKPEDYPEIDPIQKVKIANNY